MAVMSECGSILYTDLNSPGDAGMGVLDSVLWIPREDHMLEVDSLLLGSRLEFSQVMRVFDRLK